MSVLPRVATLALLALLLAACGAGGTDDEVERLEARVTELEDERDGLLAEADDLGEENERLEAELAARGDGGDGGDDDDGGEAPGPDDPSARAEPAPQRSPEGLVDQLRLLLDGQATTPDGSEPGTTAWEPFEVPDEATAAHESAGAAATTLATALAAPGLGLDVWEVTTRVLPDPEDESRARAAVLSWGWADDAVAGRDVRVTLAADDDGWRVQDAEVRYHCRRGVADGVCV